MSERCEPPPEWRDQDHDCFVEVTYHEGTKEVQTFRWWAKAQGFSQGGLLCHSGPRPPERMDIGHTVCRYVAPVTPPATVAALVEALEKVTRYAERNTCAHEETHRGGFLWEICDSCGAKWADDEGGKPEFTEPTEISTARAALALYREAGR